MGAVVDELTVGVGAFDGAEQVYVLDIYPASEPPIPGITSERLVARMRELGLDRTQYVLSEDQLRADLLRSLRPGDMILTIGAGNVWRVGEALARELEDSNVVKARSRTIAPAGA